MNTKNFNFIFFGTPQFAVYVLEELEKANHLPALVVTTPDMKIGRGNNFDSPPVKKWADTHSISILQPDKINKEFLEILREEKEKRKCDIFILTAYGKILPKELINMPKYGILNTHPSLLPRLRGASPVRTAILNNERFTGATVIILDEKMDHGPIVAQESIEIDDKDWPPLLPMLEEKLFRMGGKLLVKVMKNYIDGKINPQIQDESKATYSEKIKKEDGLVDLLRDSPKEIYTKYCALYGWPGIYFMQSGKRIKITEMAVERKLENGVETKQFIIKKVLPEGKKEISWEIFRTQSKKQ